MEEHSLPRQAGGAQEQSGPHPSGTHVSGGSSEAPGAPEAPLLPTICRLSQLGRKAPTSGFRLTEGPGLQSRTVVTSGWGCWSRPRHL